MMISTAMMLLLTQTAATPPVAAPARQATRAQVQAQAKTFFDSMDSNRDGQIDSAEAGKAFAARATAAEVRARQQREAQFTKMDNNKDNMISKQEYEAALATGRRPASPSGTSWLTTTDTDKNGKVSLNEHASQALAAFDRIDTNRDGTISPVEARASRAAQTRRR